jgi:hypothetical protein
VTETARGAWPHAALPRLASAQIPAGLDEAAARFRSLAVSRRLLVLLDNPRDAQQVRPLLPASSTCGVLVTSRRVLATLGAPRSCPCRSSHPISATTSTGRAQPDAIFGYTSSAQLAVSNGFSRRTPERGPVVHAHP